MKIFLVLIFITCGFVCQAQNELFVVNRKNESKQLRIHKGSFLRITTALGEKFSGTLIKVKDFDIVLMAYDATIDLEDITSIKVVEKGTSSVSVTPSSVWVSGNYYRKFDVKHFKFFIKKG